MPEADDDRSLLAALLSANASEPGWEERWRAYRRIPGNWLRADRLKAAAEAWSSSLSEHRDALLDFILTGSTEALVDAGAPEDMVAWANGLPDRLRRRAGRQRQPAEHFETFVELPDGRIAEEVLRYGVETFAVYDPTTRRVVYSPGLTAEGTTIKPRPVDKDEREALTLPSEVEEYGTLHDLIADMEAFALDEFDPGDGEQVFKLLVRAFLTTWLPELQRGRVEKFAPIVTARGPSQTGKKRLMTVGRFLTYRPLYQLGCD